MSATATAQLPQTPEQRAQFADAIKYCWPLHARCSQLPPVRPACCKPWRIWLIKTGRGWGKNRTAGEFIIEEIRAGRAGRAHLVAATAADARDTMVEGESGILAISPPWFRPNYEPSKRRLTWPNGAMATLFSAEEPDRLRGPQGDLFWADEVAAWKYLIEAWDNLQLGIRLGNPRGVVTSTPRPLKIFKDLIADPEVFVTHGHTLENEANLAPAYVARVLERYGSSRLGRQELAGQVLDDNPNALWKREWIDDSRVTEMPKDVSVVRRVLGLDPSATTTGDEAGIIIADKDDQKPPHYWIIADLSLQGSPTKWAKAAIAGFNAPGREVDKLIYESNQGGEMVPATIHAVDPKIPCSPVWASRGKRTRAEPIATLAEQGRIHHFGNFPVLEDELCAWEPGEDSPNHLDAMVWAVTELSTGAPRPEVFSRKGLGI